ncbi:peptidoglycan-binding domain-containing protein [Pseudanabaena mucicola]|uniref:Peptidoglycan-binding protein n=1 Tax=Pseudanabaena mucicola FACHB-723 TaxID=2692860 RepID=A0ABR7ZSQ5_9CYAN|nr:peptidoglycan-binding protein [Pseudanabaena mucicola]MBD2186579.1 peptidoglycan-binding protein [Pseudanabaena mucicola FACHB-723]
MELLTYIQEDVIDVDFAIASDIPESFQVWLANLTHKSSKLSLSLLLAGTTMLVGLGSTLNAIAADAPSSDMQYVQTLLANNGFYTGDIDGVAGTATKNAILRAQQAYNLPADGIVGSQTIAALEGGKVDKSESVTVDDTQIRTSSTVMNLQKLLTDRGFYNGAVDGLMGDQTRTAIIAAQKAYNLNPDGIAGQQTLAALESDGVATKEKELPNNTKNKSAEISNLQELLQKRGFYNGAVDGIMGDQTRTAIIAAQKSYGLTADGIAGPQTINALESGSSTVTKSESATDKDVAAVQQLLAKRGFYQGAIDGIRGKQTDAAIVAAQKAYGLTVDGIAGSQTIAALEKDAKVATPAATTTNQAAKNAQPVKDNTDNNITNLQNLLTDRGFYNGPISGILGARTREAIVAAQKAYGLTADGIAGPRTIAALESGSPKQTVTVTPVPVPPAPVTPIPVIPTPVVTAPVTPTIRVEPKPQVTPIPQPTVAAAPPTATPIPPIPVAPSPKPQPTAAAPTPTVAATPKPTTQPTAAATPTITTPPATTAAANNQIAELQRLLAQKGFYTGKVDGVLSGETRNAIVRAQNFYTISPADGSPSNKLLDELNKDKFISEGN